ncbi:MAG: phage tail tube protein [Azoarcus sp.]|jgi:hypothetical protein|nr:phage tail tube protein [Azoarcus sp.]
MAQLNNIRTVSVPSFGKLPLGGDPGTFAPSGYTREHVPGRLPEDGGYTEAGQPATLTLNINLLGGIDPQAINGIVNEDVTVRLADGQVHMLSQAWVSAVVEMGNDSAQITILANTSERIS